MADPKIFDAFNIDGNEDSEKSKTDLEEELSTLYTQLAAKEEKIRELEAELKELNKKELSEDEKEELEGLKVQVENLKKDNEALLTKIQEKEEYIKTLTTERDAAVASAQVEISAQRAEIESLKEEIKAWEIDFDKQSQELMDLQKEYDESLLGLLEEHEKDLKEKSDNLSKVIEFEKRYKQKYFEKQAAVKSLESKMSELQSKIDEFSSKELSEDEKEELAHLRVEIENKNTEIKDLNNQLTAKDEEIIELKRKLTAETTRADEEKARADASETGWINEKHKNRPLKIAVGIAVGLVALGTVVAAIVVPVHKKNDKLDALDSECKQVQIGFKSDVDDIYEKYDYAYTLEQAIQNGEEIVTDKDGNIMEEGSVVEGEAVVYTLENESVFENGISLIKDSKTNLEKIVAKTVSGNKEVSYSGAYMTAVNKFNEAIADRDLETAKEEKAIIDSYAAQIKGYKTSSENGFNEIWEALVEEVKAESNPIVDVDVSEFVMTENIVHLFGNDSTKGLAEKVLSCQYNKETGNVSILVECSNGGRLEKKEYVNHIEFTMEKDLDITFKDIASKLNSGTIKVTKKAYVKELSSVNKGQAKTTINGIEVSGTIMAYYTIDLKFNPNTNQTTYSAEAMAYIINSDGNIEVQSVYKIEKARKEGKISASDLAEEIEKELKNQISNDYDIIASDENEME